MTNKRAKLTERHSRAIDALVVVYEWCQESMTDLSDTSVGFTSAKPECPFCKDGDPARPQEAHVADCPYTKVEAVLRELHHPAIMQM